MEIQYIMAQYDLVKGEELLWEIKSGLHGMYRASGHNKEEAIESKDPNNQQFSNDFCYQGHWTEKLTGKLKR